MLELTVRQRIAAIVLLVFLAMGGILIFINDHQGQTREYILADSPSPQIMAHICGAVAKPGVISLKPGTRKYEALQLAGGALPEADIDQINLAEFVEDGEQIYLPQKGETNRRKRAPTIAKRESKSTSTRSKAAEYSDVKSSFDLNTASVKDLEAIPGIGPSLATRILEYRKKQGKLLSCQELLKVTGIGPKKLDQIQSYLYIK